jgi:quinolinate synthase
MVQNPDAEVIAHPECEEQILRHAKHIASTSGLIEYARRSPARKFIVATEAGILHKMQEAAQDLTRPRLRTFLACNMCPHMRRMPRSSSLRATSSPRSQCPS